eukprot:CAMPEP_0183313470 /NCGR_PEP_ID=MMETSP0160_2-20130417/45428_1 /TAXON_ID=2839 ORGANISM="Odontella Sinensis, Strain Grunow 1884" /NCGR_SAMPLE_ID=MMETSP0160_2 /ASSEMBLY_ACC=CAM_ASM_000250 /LENGTH=58 /DNA_ID=CAMNT_0025478565 /DNA_START=23 /DNA_END=195 /DNA_ORIENTATION=-
MTQAHHSEGPQGAPPALASQTRAAATAGSDASEREREEDQGATAGRGHVSAIAEESEA